MRSAGSLERGVGLSEVAPKRRSATRLARLAAMFEQVAVGR
jgi:hypothetical protein